MISSTCKRITFGALCTLCFPAISMAATMAATTDDSWAVWLTNQLSQHPEIVSARETMHASLSLADGFERPLYNPELALEFEREGDADNYQVGVSQTIDWSNKRDVRKTLGLLSRQHAAFVFEQIEQEKATQALEVLIEWQSASRQAELAKKQETQLDTLLALLEERQQAGDLGQIDAELAYLSLSQILSAAAQAQVKRKQAERRVRELFANSPVAQLHIPDQFWQALEALPNALAAGGSDRTNQQVDQHPGVSAAKVQWDIAQQSAILTHRDAKGDPSIGINAGKSDEENLLAVSFSIPLNLRNNFSARTRAASAEALAAQAQYHAIKRKQLLSMQTTLAVLQEYQQRFERWEHLMRGRGKRSGNLLERLWQSGDMSTGQYLMTLQQRTDGLSAGIELRTQYQLARIHWLLETGQVNQVLRKLTRKQNEE